jgi:hypothetical protein
MPRLTPALLLHAFRLDPLLPSLLRECRTLPSARNELRWLRERALFAAADSRQRGVAGGARVPGWRIRLRSMVRERARGRPLQYILGDQPLGELEILCREEVLIPRLVSRSVLFSGSMSGVSSAPLID